MKKTFYGVAMAIVSFTLTSITRANAISMYVPGMGVPTTSGTSPGAFVSGIYQFALMIAGVLAFGVIIYGGVRYMTSMGNPSGQSDAKEWIEAALLGLLLLIGAYFVLNIVNPRLTTLTLPVLQPINLSSQQAGAGGGCGAQVCTGNNNPGSVPPGTEPQGQDGCPTTNACGANGGACAGDCPNSTDICAATGATPNNTGAGTLPWHCIANTAFK
jgi:hypothetical protein